jgi:hypothetical protein
VLAQLEQRADVETAEVDRRGELLRIRTRWPGANSAILDHLELMGFAAEDAPEVASSAVRWYGSASVVELSREESVVIAARVVPAFGAGAGLTDPEIDRLTTRVATALYECFIGRSDAGLASGGLVSSCGAAVEAATSAVVGADRAAALGNAIESDLSSTRPG